MFSWRSSAAAQAALLLLLLPLAQCSMDFENEQFAEDFQNFLRELPRYDFTFQKVNSTWDPASLDYYESLILIASPCILFGVLSILVGVLFSTCGMCCVQCWPRKENGYSFCERLWPSICVLILAFLLAVMMGLGYYAEHTYDQSFRGVVNDVVQTTISESNLVNTTIQAVLSYDGEFAPQLPPDLDEWAGSLSNITNLVVSIEDDIIDPLESIRHDIIVFGFTDVLLVCVIAGFGALIMCGCCSCPAILFALSCISICWICSGFNLFESVFIADMCPEIDTYVQEDVFPDDVSQYVNYYLFCEGNKSVIFFPFPQSIEAGLLAIEAAIVASEASGNETRTNNLKNDQEELQYISSLADQLMNCTVTMNLYDNSLNTICIQLFNGLFTITSIEILAGFFLVVLIFFLVFGLRRWPYKKKSTKSMQYEYMESELHIHNQPYEVSAPLLVSSSAPSYSSFTDSPMDTPSPEAVDFNLDNTNPYVRTASMMDY